jgi:tetratricopeptide (TPR) repeat protein
VYLKLNFLKAFGELLMTTMEDEGIAEDVLLENLSSLAHFIKESEIKEALNLKKTGPKEEEKLNPFENLELANLLFEIGSTDEAKTEYYKTARAFLSRELKDKAQELFVKIKELYPDEKELEALKVEIDEYGIKKESKDPAARRERLAAITARFENENEARVRYSVAVILKEYGRYDQATEELEVLFQLPKSPEKIKAYVLLSQMYLDSKDSTAAIGVLKDAIARGEFEGDELVPIEYKLGTLYEKAKQYDEALRIFQIALDKDNEYLDIIDRVKNVKELIKKQEEEAERAVEEAEREAEAIADAEEAGIEKIVKVEEPEQAEPKKKKVVEKVAVQEEKPTMQERILYI